MEIAASSNARPVPVPRPIPRYRKVRSNYFLDFSIKEGRYVEFESSLEYDIWLYMECNPLIEHLVEQAPTIQKVINGKKFLYTFDLWLRETSGYERCIEVKPVAKLVIDSDGKSQPKKWKVVLPIADELGLHASFLTDQFVKANQQYIGNLHQIYPFIKEANIAGDHSLLDKVVHYCGRPGGISLKELLSLLSDIPVQYVVQTAFYSIYLGKVTSNLDEQPNNMSLVLEAVDV